MNQGKEGLKLQFSILLKVVSNEVWHPCHVIADSFAHLNLDGLTIAILSELGSMTGSNSNNSHDKRYDGDVAHLETERK